MIQGLHGESPREIEKESGISRSSVHRIARHDLQIKVFKCKKRTCCLTLIEFLQRNLPDFIEPALWPANSPDLNLTRWTMSCGVCCSRCMVYRDSIASLNYLKEKIQRCWAELSSQRLIDRAVDQWRPGLQAVVKAKGGHI